MRECLCAGRPEALLVRRLSGWRAAVGTAKVAFGIRVKKCMPV